MDFSHDVILDLLPIYLAGEASPGTRALVDQYLDAHPDMAERVRRASQEPAIALPPMSPPPELELRSLRRTMRLLAWQHRLFALALWLTGVSLMAAISIQQGRLHIHFLMQDSALRGACISLATTCWAYYFIVRYRLRVTR